MLKDDLVVLKDDYYWKQFNELKRFAFLSNDQGGVVKVAAEYGNHVNEFEVSELISDAQDTINSLLREIEALENRLSFKAVKNDNT